MKPIIFNTEMVRAILDGCKTVTRRVVKLHANGETFVGIKYLGSLYAVFSKGKSTGYEFVRLPYRPGDILYVRETWAPVEGGGYIYRAGFGTDAPLWRPSIHMPREAARIFLRVTNVRVERLQDINEGEAKKEGFVNDIDLIGGTGKSAARHFADLWDSTIKKSDIDKYSWEANPWVWVIEFKRISKEEAE